MSSVLLHCTGVTKYYNMPAGRIEVLKGIDLELEKYSLTFIVGRSGAGKSTLLHILSGLDKPTDGAVVFDGIQLETLNERKRSEVRNKRFGFVFQFYHLIPELTVLENVMLPGLIARTQVRDKAAALLARVGLTERLAHFPYQLSGGEQQRVALARALVNDPEIVFCDEPTGNLDAESAQMIVDLIEELNRECKQTFCIVTHEQSIVAERERIYILAHGIINTIT